MDLPASSSKDTTVENPNVLPPEYDENDSRWTLKYREPAPGLVELIKHSGVYVNADKLAEFEKWSSDCKAFARMLLTEIFTISALSTCSWSGETTNASAIHGGQASPVLNEHAKDTLQKYVINYGQIRNWNRTDIQCILKSIRQIMLEMRSVRQNKFKKEEESCETLKDNGFQFVLPPEYDKNNSRWTLKYREYAPGLVELIKDSCVFVELSQLAKFKRSSKDSVTLARMLLNEIFIKSAMSTCSWNDQPTYRRYSNHNGSNVRPELDNNAMVALLRFVADYELENGWIKTNREEIETSIRQKLILLRRVVGKREEAENADKRQKKRLRFFHHHMDSTPEFASCQTDRRWTLKYRGPAPELVELMDDSGVYVRADKLAEFLEKSNDCRLLAEMLITEVFSYKALCICKLSLNNNELYNIPSHGNYIKYLPTPEPGSELDTYAEIILLNFVDEYALEKGWTMYNFQLIRKRMVHKIHEIRPKPYRKKQIVSQTDCISNSFKLHWPPKQS